ncbi:iron-sulfur cluster assembly scaffold protein [Marivivens donghaensis]|uniref:Iron-sulfur cluster assembly scaffold protein n=1 Tax=Marivivens donghaensis TaxID=1699413 RepID=A0ABX0VZA4_9RHOB|nr:iron-sulfur cluster assembly scaffold protein [Marivivens donghaensis]
MSDTSDLVKLYSSRILALTADMPLTERLENPDATVKKRAPLCGSTVTVDVKMQDGVITSFGQDVKACALGQASAAIMGGTVIGRTRAEIEKARDELRAMLKDDGPVPAAPFGELEVLLPAREYKNRHASILLAFDATVEAAAQAEA